MGLRSLAAVGDRVWVGLASGALRVLSTAAKPALLGEWAAGDTPVTALVQAGRRVFSLTLDGAVRAWSAAVPSPHDQECRWLA